jgi:DNA-binding NarL/FixJ family response regulator
MQWTDRSDLPLSGREVTLVTLVARGLSNHEIARTMHLSAHTIKHGVERLSQKLGVRNRVELAAWAGSNRHYRPSTDEYYQLSEKGPVGPSRSPAAVQ